MTADRKVLVFKRVIACFAMLLFAVTWKLWTPQTDIAQIPFSGWLINTPWWVDWIGLAGVGLGLGLLLFSSTRRSTLVSTSILAGSLTLSILLNQHRLQPWAYLLFVYCIYLATLNNRDALRWMRWTVSSVYVFSAISKLDYQFVFSVGQQMLGTLLGFVGIDASGLSSETMTAVVLLLPMGELIAGALILFPQTRLVGGWLAITLHITLLILLGPLGLDHQAGVLVWNIFFAVQAWLLFVCQDASPESDAEPAQRKSLWFGKLVGAIVLATPMTCMILPTLELPVQADHWVAWEVYAPRSSRAYLSWQNDEDAGTLEAVSLEYLGVPLYPQARFQAACLLAQIYSKKQGYFDLRHNPIVVASTSDRLTGERETVRLDNPMARQKFWDSHWLNLKPRALSASK